MEILDLVKTRTVSDARRLSLSFYCQRCHDDLKIKAMALRTKILDVRKKTFDHTREAIQWAEKTFIGDSENAEELSRFRLMVRDIKEYEGSTTTITVIFDTDGAIHRFEVFGSIPWRTWAHA